MNDASSLRRFHGSPVRWCGLAAGGLGLVVTLTAAAAPSAQRAALSPAPDPVTNFGNSLVSVSAVSSADAWAVGDSPSLALHWNGTRWARTAIPHFGTSLSALKGVSALSASDAWAVGSVGDVSTTTLALHWNGTAWARVATPSPGQFSQLTSVSALSPTDAFAVGDLPGLALHWNGTSWVQAAVPNPANSALLGVSALSASDAWAVGGQRAGNVTKTLVLHWNGTSWTHVPSPSPRGVGIGPFTFLDGVSAVSSSDAWSVGCACTSDTDSTLILRWNGKTWTRS